MYKQYNRHCYCCDVLLYNSVGCGVFLADGAFVSIVMVMGRWTPHTHTHKYNVFVPNFYTYVEKLGTSRKSYKETNKEMAINQNVMLFVIYMTKIVLPLRFRAFSPSFSASHTWSTIKYDYY